MVLYDGGCTARKCRVVEIAGGSIGICGGYLTDSLVDAHTILFKGYGIQNSNDHVISWQWSFGDGHGANTQQVKHVYTNGGNFEVCLSMHTDKGCQTRICKNISIASGVERQLVLSPNPVEKILHVVFQSSESRQVNIYIYNANGNLIKTDKKNATAGNNTWEFDVSSLPPGIYSFIVQWNNGLANAVFIKQ
jgi:PKD repeat protein